MLPYYMAEAEYPLLFSIPEYTLSSNGAGWINFPFEKDGAIPRKMFPSVCWKIMKILEDVIEWMICARSI